MKTIEDWRKALNKKTKKETPEGCSWNICNGKYEGCEKICLLKGINK